jgi:hypothetical protein
MVLNKVDKNVSLLEKENISLGVINDELNAFKKVILNFQERFSTSKTILNDLIGKIRSIEITARDEIDNTLLIAKQDIQKFFNVEQKRILKTLEEKSKKILDEKFQSEKLKIEDYRIKFPSIDRRRLIKHFL